MKHLQFLNFDTNLISTTTPFDCNFQLADPLRRVKRIYLKSVELPINFFNVRSNFNSFNITLYKATSPTAYKGITITIQNGNYKNIADLFNVLNGQMYNIVWTGFTPSDWPYFSVNENNTITLSNTNPDLRFNLQSSNFLTQIFGFTNLPTTYSNSITSSRIYNLNYDNYLSIYCPNIPHKSSSFSNQLMTFKIPFNSVSGSIYYTAENISYSHYIEITDEHFVLDRVQIQVYDQFNNLLNNQGVNWSFTLAFELF